MSLVVQMTMLFLLSVLLVGAVRYYAQRFLLDSPNERSSHSVATPRGGGLGGVLAYCLAIAYYCTVKELNMQMLGLTLIGLGIALLGFLDDHGHVPVRWRMLTHLSASALALYFLPPLPFLMSFGWVGYVLGVLFLTWSLNLFNFMDGIDGIAGSEALFVATALAGFAWESDPTNAKYALCLAVVIAGFLLWNWPPAKIFMGDVGSGFIGFMLGVLILNLSQSNLVFVVTGLILFALFVVDASFTLIWRLLSGQKFYQAHCSHAYQHAAKRYGHLKVVLLVWIVNLCYLLPLAILAFNNPAYVWGVMFCAYLPLIGLAYFFKAGRVGI